MDKHTPSWQLRYFYPLDVRDPIALAIVVLILTTDVIAVGAFIWILLFG